MRHRQEPREAAYAPTSDVDPVDVFLAQPDFVEEPGLDEAALERQRILDQGPNADAIVVAIEMFNEHHPFP
jgi:hypothetical protein